MSQLHVVSLAATLVRAAPAWAQTSATATLDTWWRGAFANDEATQTANRAHLQEQGHPVVAANVAMVYLDIGRVLFSADGRAEPIATDSKGRFRIEHVAAGRVAFVTAAPDQAPSNIEELAVVASAAVELHPFERPNDPQFLKMMLEIRRVEATTGADGRFLAKGLTGDRLIVQASKPGYTTAMKFGVKLDDANLTIEVRRGVFVRGKVLVGEEPLARFRVDTRTSDVPKPEDAKADTGDAGVASAGAGRGRRNAGGGGSSGSGSSGIGSGNRGSSNDDGGGMRMGLGGRGMRTGTVQMAEGQTMMDRGIDGNWREVQAADGTFELRGIPPGRVRVCVRADGYLDAPNQEVDLLHGQTSDVLAFHVEPSHPVAGRVVDERGQPVSDAQVIAYKQRDTNARRGMFAVKVPSPESPDQGSDPWCGLQATIQRVVKALVRDGTDRDDIAQDLAMKLLTGAHESDAVRNAEAYLVTAARNLLRNRARAAKRRGLLLLPPEDFFQLAATPTPPSLDSMSIIERVSAYLGEREQLVMTAWLQSPFFKSVARDLGLEVRQVKRALSRCAVEVRRCQDDLREQA